MVRESFPRNPVNVGLHVIGENCNSFNFSKEELNEIQQSLLQIAEEQIVRKKLINLYPLDLFEIAKNKINFEENVLFDNISELYQAKWIVPGEGLLKSKVLDTLKHRQIFEYVKKNPGCNTFDIMLDLGISFRYALKNLETLFKFSFIRVRKYSQYFLYFPYYIQEEEDLIYYLTRNARTRKILEFLLKRRLPCAVSEIAHALNAQESTVQRKLGKLVKAEIVSLVQSRRKLKYKINKLDKKVFESILNRYRK